MNPVPDTCPVKVAVAAFILVEEIPVENDPLTPSISPVTSPVRLPVTSPVKAPSKAAETIPEKIAEVPDTGPVNVAPAPNT